MVVASLPDGCAARNSLCAQVLHHAGLTGGLATWQPEPQGLRDHFGGAWAHCLCSCSSSRQRSPPRMISMFCCPIQNTGRRDSLIVYAITASLGLNLSHSSMQSSPPSFHIWQRSGLWQVSAPSVLRQEEWRSTCIWCQLLALGGREGPWALLPEGLLLGSFLKVKIT